MTFAAHCAPIRLAPANLRRSALMPLELDDCMAEQPHRPRDRRNGTDTSTDDSVASITKETTVNSGAAINGAASGATPVLSHKVRNRKSVLALAVSKFKIFAGTQGGEISVWSLKAYELLSTIIAHRGAVLSLCISQDGKFLFSSAGDAIVNVWCTRRLSRLYSIYSTYDVGDVFCLAYSEELRTIYLGAQNTSIQWYNLSHKDSRPSPTLASHPSHRFNRFFDSKGPGGVSTPRPTEAGTTLVEGGRILEIDKNHIVQYAHFGYVYCMIMARSLNVGETGKETLISGGGDGTIKIWELGEDGVEELRALENGDNSILTMALDGTFLYCGRLEGDVNVWDLDTFQLVRRVRAYDNEDVLTLAIGHECFFTGGADGWAKEFDRRYECRAQWKAHDQLILASTVTSYKGKMIYVTGGNDDCIAVWDIGELGQKSSGKTETGNEELVESLRTFVSFRTVSSQPCYAEHCRRGASWLRGLFKKFGAATEMLSTDERSNPVVYAQFKGRSSPGKLRNRILFYGHYDVVAADDEQKKWIIEPFEMEGRNGYLYGRGVSDNKGPVLAAIYAVADLVAEQRLESDIIFLIEGEEECGSCGFQAAIRRNKHVIGAIDWILLANSYWLNDDFPCLTYGLRGVIHAIISVKSTQPDLHSGVDGSHLMDEPLKDLVTLVSKLTGTKGQILIPDFYSSILSITTAEERRYDAISKTLLDQDPGLGDAEALTSSLKARWREPSLTIHGFQTSGLRSTTVIPHIASVAISLRIVPNQDVNSVHQMLENYLKHQFSTLHSSNKLFISVDHKAEPWLGDLDNEIFLTLKRAIMEVWGPVSHHRRRSVLASKTPDKGHIRANSYPPTSPATSSTLTYGSSHGSQASEETLSPEVNGWSDSPDSLSGQKPLYIREGGSISAIRFLEKEFDAPAAHLPCGQASDSAHLDNERLRLINLYKSREIFRKVFGELPNREREKMPEEKISP